MIPDVQSYSAAPMPEIQLVERENSNTTWKTHSYVVGGFLLISIGFILVTTSLCISTVIHPLLAFATPLLPIIVGSILLNRKNILPKKLKKTDPPPFKGLVNEGGNDCWINATMQLLIQTPAFARRIQTTSKSLRLSSHPLETVFDAFHSYQTKGAASSQTLRKWLDKQHVTTKSDPNTQDDPIQFILHFMKKIDYQLPTLYEKEIDRVKEEIVRQNQSQTSSHNPLRFFDLAFYVDPKNPTLTGAFDRFFCDSETLPSGTKRTRTRFMKRPPQELSVSLSQAAEGDVVVKTPINCPMRLEMPSSYLGDQASYDCDAFIYHSGNSAGSGHWIAVIKKNGKWWEANDASVTEISETSALKQMSVASFIHYAKC